jgi:chromosome segregation ATPase
MRQFPRVLLFWALIAAAGLGASFVTRAQAPAAAPSSDILPSLLVEVRGLRAAMEQMAAAGPRVQLALGRLQLQEQRIQTLVRRLEEAKVNQGRPEREYHRLGERIKEIGELIPTMNDDTRRQLEFELKVAKSEHARLGGEMQKIAAEEAFLTQEIANEQARWSDFNQRLEELERSLIKP